MSALSQENDTPARSGDLISVPVAAGVKVWKGALVVVVAASGFAKGAVAAVGLVGLGRAEETVDNTGGADGALSVKVGRKIYRFDNSSAADLITQANIGSQAYAVDDHTVALTSNSNARSAIGTIFDVDDGGVWIKFS